MLAVKKWTVGGPRNEANCIWLVPFAERKGLVMHAAIIKLSPWNDLTQWSDNKMLTSAISMFLLYSMTQMRAMKRS